MFTSANIIRIKSDKDFSDEEYYSGLDLEQIPYSSLHLPKKKILIILYWKDIQSLVMLKVIFLWKPYLSGRY